MEELERSTAAASRVDPEGLLKMYDELGRLDVHSVMVTRYGKVIAEGWWNPYKAEYNHIQYSVSKSFVGTAVGFAVSEGLLTVDDKVLDILDGILPSEPCENMRELTIRNVLTMSTGHQTERNMFQKGETWIYSLLSSYIDGEPGKEFRYISSSTYILSAVIWKLTGQTVFDYLKPRLFEPLGFSENIWWETSPEGLNTGFNGFNATAEDITKLALLYLNKGRWKGRQILSEDWIREASQVQIENDDNEKNQELGYHQGFGRFSKDWKSGYGYLFWHCVPEGVFRGDGIYGQMCIVMPRQNMTIAVASGCSEPDKILDVIWRNLLPAVDAENVSIRGEECLKSKLRSLEIPTVKGERRHPDQKYFSGRVYQTAKNGLGIRQIAFTFPEKELPFVSILTEKGIFRAEIGYGRWIETDTGYDSEGFSCDNVIFFSQAACTGAWQGDEYVVKIVYTRTPFIDILRVRFLDGGIIGTYTHTVKYGQKKHEIMGIEKETL